MGKEAPQTLGAAHESEPENLISPPRLQIKNGVFRSATVSDG